MSKFTRFLHVFRVTFECFACYFALFSLLLSRFIFIWYSFTLFTLLDDSSLERIAQPFTAIHTIASCFLLTCLCVYANLYLLKLNSHECIVCVCMCALREHSTKETSNGSVPCVYFFTSIRKICRRKLTALIHGTVSVHIHTRSILILLHLFAGFYSVFFACNLKERKMSSERTRKTFIRMCIGRHSVHLYHMTRWHCKNFHKSAQRKVAYVCGCSYDICIKCDYFHCSISSNISLETIHFSESAYNKWTIKVKSGFNNTTME